MQLAEGADIAEATEEAAEQQERRKERNKERLREMRDYADATTCRRELLLRYFGDDFAGPCNNCDNCERDNPEMALEVGRRHPPGGSSVRIWRLD